MAETQPMTNAEFKEIYGRNIGEFHPLADELMREIPRRSHLNRSTSSKQEQDPDSSRLEHTESNND